MTPEPYRPQPAGPATYIWSVFFFLVFACLIVAAVRWSGASRDYGDKRATVRTKANEDRGKDDREKLMTAAWIDQAGGIVRVPIFDAKRLVIAELQAKKPAPSQVKVDPPLPMPIASMDPAAPYSPALPSAPQGSDTLSFGAFAPVSTPAASSPGGVTAPNSGSTPAAASTPAGNASTPGAVPAPGVPAPVNTSGGPATPASLPSVSPAPTPLPHAEGALPARPPLIDAVDNPNSSSK